MDRDVQAVKGQGGPVAVAGENWNFVAALAMTHKPGSYAILAGAGSQERARQQGWRVADMGVRRDFILGVASG